MFRKSSSEFLARLDRTGNKISSIIEFPSFLLLFIHSEEAGIMNYQKKRIGPCLGFPNCVHTKTLIL